MNTSGEQCHIDNRPGDRPRPVPTGVDRLFDPVWLYAMYVDAHCSITRIGSVVGVEDRVVAGALKAAGISRRGVSDPRGRFPKLRDVEFLVEALTVRQLSLRDVAREVGCAEQTVQDAISRPEVADRLQAAGWSRGWPTGRSRSSRVPTRPFPPVDVLVATVNRLGSGGWVSMRALREALDVSENQYHSFRRHLDALIDRGVLSSTRQVGEWGGRASLHVRSISSGEGEPITNTGRDTR